jgi:hypothetical protein
MALDALERADPCHDLARYALAQQALKLVRLSAAGRRKHERLQAVREKVVSDRSEKFVRKKPQQKAQNER